MKVAFISWKTFPFALLINIYVLLIYFHFTQKPHTSNRHTVAAARRQKLVYSCLFSKLYATVKWYLLVLMLCVHFATMFFAQKFYMFFICNICLLKSCTKYKHFLWGAEPLNFGLLSEWQKRPTRAKRGTVQQHKIMSITLRFLNVVLNIENISPMNMVWRRV